MTHYINKNGSVVSPSPEGKVPAGLDAVLAVRTAVLNDTYDVFCEQHSHLVA